MATTARAAPHRARGRAHGAPRARRARCACGVVRTGVPDGRTETFRFELAGGKPVTEDITATIEGSSLVCETIARPLGITFEERGGRCVVDAVVEGSNAESADVQSGDILRMCTAILTTTPKVDELSYYSNPPSKVYLPCLFDTTDQSFERVMGALISNGELADVEGRKEEIEEIQLVLERPAA